MTRLPQMLVLCGLCLIVGLDPADLNIRAADVARLTVGTASIARLTAGTPEVARLTRPGGLGVALSAQTLPLETIRLGVLKDGAYEVTAIPLETYVARVLAGEALPGSEPAALEALAIAVRTYTVANRTRHRADGFDLCDQTHCQVLRTANAATERAAAATAGKLLLYKGAPASIYYSASCGGHTERPSNVWPGAENPPYLPSRSDDGCGGAPQWTAELSTADLQRAFSAFGFRGTLRAMRIASRNESGRVQTLALDGMTPDRISGQDLRAAVGRTLGWMRVLSTDFELRRSGSAYRFSGRGSGHGVGMCVIGSTKLALRGRSAEDILSQYFPGTDIGTLASSSLAPPAPPTVGTDARMPVSPPPAVGSGSRSASAASASAPTVSAGSKGSAGSAGSSGPAGATASPGTAAPTSVGDVLLSLPEGDEGERAGLVGLVRRERDELARALGVRPPPRLTLRFHPTVDAFQRASGRPWFVLGAAAAGDLEFVPVSVLRERGILERAVRRQLVHALADPSLSRAPAWAREGAALYFSEPSSAGSRGGGRAECPRDIELLQPVSAGALTDAYARARACFARQVESGRAWHDVR